jgi:hypothetical protein
MTDRSRAEEIALHACATMRGFPFNERDRNGFPAWLLPAMERYATEREDAARLDERARLTAIVCCECGSAIEDLDEQGRGLHPVAVIADCLVSGWMPTTRAEFERRHAPDETGKEGK